MPKIPTYRIPYYPTAPCWPFQPSSPTVIRDFSSSHFNMRDATQLYILLLLHPPSSKGHLLSITCSGHHLKNSKSTPHPTPRQQRKGFVGRNQPNTPYYPRLAFRVATCLPSQLAISNLRSLRVTWSFFLGLQRQL